MPPNHSSKLIKFRRRKKKGHAAANESQNKSNRNQLSGEDRALLEAAHYNQGRGSWLQSTMQTEGKRSALVRSHQAGTSKSHSCFMFSDLRPVTFC